MNTNNGKDDIKIVIMYFSSPLSYSYLNDYFLYTCVHFHVLVILLSVSYRTVWLQTQQEIR